MTQNLSVKINKHFILSDARLNCLVQIIFALIKVSSVNLGLLATAYLSNAKLQSIYRQLQRFFSEFAFSTEQFVQFILCFFNLQNENCFFALDRTNWAYGKTQINILTLAIINKGVAIPLFWLFLDKKGNSNTEERIKLLNTFLAVFPASKITVLLCDREFIGVDWLNFLMQKSITFCIRIKENMKIYCPKGKNINKSIRQLGRGCSIVFDGFYSIGDKEGVQTQGVKIAALRRLDNNELVIIVTNGNPREALNHYAKRWGIEVLYADLKKRGFNLEDTHLRESARISTMLHIVTIAYVWAIETGDWCCAKEPIRLKTHGRKEISIFKKGLNYLRRLLYNVKGFSAELLHIIDLIPDPNSLTNTLSSLKKSIT